MPCSRQSARPVSASSSARCRSPRRSAITALTPCSWLSKRFAPRARTRRECELGLLLGLVAPIAHQAVGPGDQGARHQLGARLRRPLRQGDGLMADGDGRADLGQVDPDHPTM